VHTAALTSEAKSARLLTAATPIIARAARIGCPWLPFDDCAPRANRGRLYPLLDKIASWGVALSVPGGAARSTLSSSGRCKGSSDGAARSRWARRPTASSRVSLAGRLRGGRRFPSCQGSAAPPAASLRCGMRVHPSTPSVAFYLLVAGGVLAVLSLVLALSDARMGLLSLTLGVSLGLLFAALAALQQGLTAPRRSTESVLVPVVAAIEAVPADDRRSGSRQQLQFSRARLRCPRGQRRR